MWEAVLIAVVALAAVVGLLVFYGRQRWRSATQALHRRLDAARPPHLATGYSERDLAGLPTPVQRYFRAVLTDGQPRVHALRVEHAGRFNTGGANGRWTPFTSAQRIVTEPPGFVWDARMALVPGASVRVHDAYVGGEGVLQVKLLGLLPIFAARGTPELAQGELMRYLAEAAWYPTALLPPGVRWQPVDDRSARATIEDGGLGVSMLFCFDDSGLVASVGAEARGRTVNRTVVPTPWEGRWSRYETRDGMRIPLEGEVAWLLTEGRQPYWRGRITLIEYEWATP